MAAVDVAPKQLPRRPSSKAGPKSKAANRFATSVAAGKSAARNSWTYWLGKLPGMFTRNSLCLLLGLTFCVLMSGQSGPIRQVSRMLGSIANVAEATSEQVIAGLETSSNVSQAVVQWARDIAVASSNVLSDAWHGVDLKNLEITRSEGSTTVVAGFVFSHWLYTPNGKVVVELPDAQRAFLKQSVDAASASMPFVANSKDFHNVTSVFRHLDVKTWVMANGYLHISWRYDVVEYVVKWSNPTWEITGFDPVQQMKQIQSIIQEVLDNQPGTASQSETKDLVFAPWTPHYVQAWVRISAVRFINGVAYYLFSYE